MIHFYEHFFLNIISYSLFLCGAKLKKEKLKREKIDKRFR